MSATYRAADAQLQALYARVLGGNLGLAQLWFSPDVLDAYRARGGVRVMRTNSVGRVQSPEGWSFDFGIAAADEALHATLNDLVQRLPERERQHWLEHVIALPTSRNFLTMRLAPGSCIDDGDLRAW
jgi:hypothetical protein